jgi:hypothetical protein
MKRSTLEIARWRWLALGLCLVGSLGGGAVGCSSGGYVEEGRDGGTTPPRGDLAMRDLLSPGPRDLTEPMRVLKSFSGCPIEMFAATALVDDFDNQSTLDINWQWQNDGRFPRPKLALGALVFGPHNLKPDEWWNNWTPVRSFTEFADVLYCVRFRMSVPSSATTGDSSFDISLRGESGGMVLTTLAGSNTVILHSKKSESEWVEFGRNDLVIKRDVEQTIDAIIYGKGSHFYGEARNVESGAIVGVVADYALPPKAVVGMLGWRVNDAVRVDRAVVGTPSTQALALLSDK